MTWFRTFAQAVAAALGSPWAFALACLCVLAWAASGGAAAR